MGLGSRILLRYLLGYFVLYNVIPQDIAELIENDPEIALLVSGALAAGVEGVTVLARRFGWKT